MSNPIYTPRYPSELRERGVRLVKEHRNDYGSDHAAYRAIAPKLGCSPGSLRAWCRQAERDAGQRSGLTIAEKDRIKELERENRQLRQANEILKKASAYFRPVDREKIKAVYDDSTRRYGARKAWRRLVREGHRIARCTVERLMKTMGLQGAVRGNKPITTQDSVRTSVFREPLV